MIKAIGTAARKRARARARHPRAPGPVGARAPSWRGDERCSTASGSSRHRSGRFRRRRQLRLGGSGPCARSTTLAKVAASLTALCVVNDARHGRRARRRGPPRLSGFAAARNSPPAYPAVDARHARRAPSEPLVLRQPQLVEHEGKRDHWALASRRRRRRCVRCARARSWVVSAARRAAAAAAPPPSRSPRPRAARPPPRRR